MSAADLASTAAASAGGEDHGSQVTARWSSKAAVVVAAVSSLYLDQ